MRATQKQAILHGEKQHRKKGKKTAGEKKEPSERSYPIFVQLNGV